MKLHYKILFSLLLILLLTTGAMIFSGTFVITSIVKELQKQLLCNELAGVKQEIADSYATLEKHGLEHVDLYVDAAKDELFISFKKYQPNEGEELFVISAGGQLIYSSHLNLVVQDILGGSDDEKRDFLNGKSGVFNFKSLGQEHFAVYEYSSQWDWLIIVAKHTDIMFVKRQKYINYVSVCALIIASLALFLGTFLSTSMTRRLGQIMGVVKNVEAGSRDVRLPESHGSDEIAILQNGINGMIATLHTQEQERLEAKTLIDNERSLLRAMIDSIPDLIFYKDNESKYIGCNDAFAEFIDHPEVGLIGKTDYDFFPDELAAFFREKDRKVLAKKTAQRNDEWVDYPDGRRVLLHTVKTPFYNSANELLGLVGISRDMTLEDSLRERLAVTLRSIGDGVITTDTHGNITLMNKVAEDLTGWSQSDALGQPIADVFNIINEKTGKPLENPFEKVLLTGDIIGLASHTALISKSGRLRSIADSGAPIRDRESNIIGVVLVFRDVTKANLQEAELLKIRKLESVGILAGGIAHDFNNILAAILGNIELAGLSVEPTSEAFFLLDEAKKASVRAKDLTQQLLTFSKGGDPVKKTSLIGQTIRDSANFVLHGASVLCHFNIPEDLYLVDIDAGQISQVIQNLIINAKQAMPEGGDVHVTCCNIDDISSEAPFPVSGHAYIKIAVQDAGCGIAEKYLEKVFDPYFTTKQEGSGLGLATSYSIISKHNGYMTVHSEIGEGTLFTIYLPASSEQTLTSPVGKQRSETSQKTATILVMDDDPFVQAMAKRMLGRLGHNALQASDGVEAIKIFTERRDCGESIDLVIMDLTIPGGMGGKEAVGEILRLDPGAKVIVASGYSNDPVMAHCQEYGFKVAIAKPFMMDELKKVIDAVLV